MTTEREVRMAVLPIQSELAAVREQLGQVAALLSVVLSRQTDVTHLSVREIAAIDGTSEQTARRRYAEVLERRPGSKKFGVPIEKVFSGWLPLAIARRAADRQQRSVA